MLRKIKLWFYEIKLNHLKKKETKLKGLYWICGHVCEMTQKKIEELEK